MEPSNSQEEFDPLASTPSHAESADDSSTSTDTDSSDFDDSSTSSDDSYVPDFDVHVNLDCIFIFNIDINPFTYEPLFTLSAAPYIHKMRALHSVNSNKKYITEEFKPLYNFIERHGKDQILEILKQLIDNNITIDRKRFWLKRFGLIKGTFAGYYFDHKDREFKHSDFHLFFSCIDLIIRQVIELDDEKLAQQLDYQQTTYGIQLTGTEIQRLKSLLEKHPANKRKAELARYHAKVSVQTESEPTPDSTLFHSLQTLMYWFASHLSAFQEKPQPVDTDKSLEDSLEPELDSPLQRQAVIDRIRADKYDSIQALKGDLKQLFALRHQFEPNEHYYNHSASVTLQINEFCRKLTSETSWYELNVESDARHLLIEAILLTDNILADMECFIRQAGNEPNARNMADLLIDQSYGFCRDFIYTGIIDFYPIIRDKAWRVPEPRVTINGKPTFKHIKTDEVITNALFFSDSTADFAMRKLYNAFINAGFYQRYGDESAKINIFEQLVGMGDTRFAGWSTPDKKIEKPVTESWTQFFRRKISGGAAPTQEVYTYAHPLNRERPT